MRWKLENEKENKKKKKITKIKKFHAQLLFVREKETNDERKMSGPEENDNDAEDMIK